MLLKIHITRTTILYKKQEIVSSMAKLCHRYIFVIDLYCFRPPIEVCIQNSHLVSDLLFALTDLLLSA